MLLSFHRFLPLLLYVLLCVYNEAASDKLLVLYMDAMQWQYVERRLARPYRYSSTASAAELAREPSNGIYLMQKLGIHVQRVRPVYPSQCLPNIHSSFTGLHPPYHGILGSQIYDSQSGYNFNYHATMRDSEAGKNSAEAMIHHFDEAPKNWWLSQAEPLWDTVAKRTGRHALIYYVPSVYELAEVRKRRQRRRGLEEKEAHHVVLPYQRDIAWLTFRDRVLEAVGHMRKNVTDFAVVYSDQLDRDGHKYGPDSVHVDNTMMKLDSLLHSVVHETLLQPEARIHVMLMSDHGMQVIEERKKVEVEWFIFRSQIKKIINDGTTIGLWPKKGMKQQVYDRLKAASSRLTKQFSVFWKNDLALEQNGVDINDPRLPIIIVMAKKGYVLMTREFSFPRNKDTGSPQAGIHGYHPRHEEMHTPMLAFGPKLVNGKKMDHLEVTEIYQLMCNILDVSPKPHNGTFRNVAPLFKGYKMRPQASQPYAATLKGQSCRNEVISVVQLLSTLLSLCLLRLS